MNFLQNRVAHICIIVFSFLSCEVKAQYKMLDTIDFEFLADLPEQLPEVSGIILTPHHMANTNRSSGYFPSFKEQTFSGVLRNV
jgi:hypothetical protein